MENALRYVEGFVKHYSPGQARWFYEDGCVLMGCLAMYRATGQSLYRDFVLSYMERAVSPEGTILHFPMDQYNVDNINAGKALFFALDETGESRYRRAADFLMDRLDHHPRCGCGNFWHKEIYPDQIWLDGLYMAQPFRLEYSLRFRHGRDAQDVLSQFSNVRALLFSEEKGLYYHACDTARRQPWADPRTGRSPNFWLRAMGWYLMALADCRALLPGEEGEKLAALLAEAAKGILPYQDRETGLFYQVVDRADAEGNYLETSGSAMVFYAWMKGWRLGALPEAFGRLGAEGLKSLAKEKLKQDGEGAWHLTDICRSAGLGPGNRRDGSVGYYLSEPRVADDGKGVGPFLMALAEWMKQEG